MTLQRKVKTITLLGATGSVGASVLSVIDNQPGRFQLHAVIANRSASKLAQIAIAGSARIAVLAQLEELPLLKDALAGTGIACDAGPQAVEAAAAHPVDLVVAAIVGAAGIRPTWAALQAGNQIALANKECLVSAGNLFMEAARRHKKPILAGVRSCEPERRGSHYDYSVRRAVPHMDERSDCFGDAGTGAESSHLGNGCKNHDRFRVTYE